MLFILSFFKGLSSLIFVIITPVVPSGIFLVLMSCFVKFLTVIFNSLISDVFGTTRLFPTLKSSDVSSLPSFIIFVIYFLFLQIFTFTDFPTSVCATI